MQKIILLVFAVFFTATLGYTTEADSAPQGAMISFLNGFFSGIKSRETADNIRSCLNNYEAEFNILLAKLKEAEEGMMRVDEIKKGLSIFFPALKDFFTAIASCVSEDSVVHELITALANVDIDNVIR